MHELGVAESIVKAVFLEVEKNRASWIKELNTEIGELAQLDTQALN